MNSRAFQDSIPYINEYLYLYALSSKQEYNVHSLLKCTSYPSVSWGSNRHFCNTAGRNAYIDRSRPAPYFTQWKMSAFPYPERESVSCLGFSSPLWFYWPPCITKFFPCKMIATVLRPRRQCCKCRPCLAFNKVFRSTKGRSGELDANAHRIFIALLLSQHVEE